VALSRHCGRDTTGVLDKGHSSSAEVADDLVLQNHIELAQAVRRFVARMPLPRTEEETIARLLEKSRVPTDRNTAR